MIFGNLSDVLDEEQTILEAVQSKVRPAYSAEQTKKSKFSKLLARLSSGGMNYDDQVLKNMFAVPADKKLQDSDYLLQQNLYGGAMNNWKIKPDEEKSFSEKSLNDKREVLRKMAMQPELEDILDILANECIVYDDDLAYIANPFLDTAMLQELNEKNAEEIKNAVDAAYYKLYMLLKFKQNAWNIFKRWLVEGVICYEIIYDNIENPKSIINIVEVDPATLTITIKDGVQYWVQFKDVIGYERWLLDAQIIYIKYEDSGVIARQSYLERLIRPFNLYRIVEQAQVIWTVTQSSFKTMFTIPIEGMNRAKGMQTLNAAMNRYKEDISFNAETGELQVNGRTNMPFNKEYWLPQNQSGKPEIETLVDSGPQLSDSDQLKYFESKLYKMSKIPESRFDKDAQSTWFGSDPTQQLRDEINFSRFVTRLRNTFSELILKPLRIQLTLSIPDIKNDKRILDAVSLHFNSYNQFEEMMNIEIMTKRTEFISTMKDSLVFQDKDGNDIQFFDPEFLIVKYLHMSDADLELNEKYKEKHKLAEKEKGDESDEGGDEESEGGSDDMGLGGGDNGGESDEGSDLDSEMLGDVQPESSETTQI